MVAIDSISTSPLQGQEAQPQDERNPAVLRAARLYENQFLREMVRAMKKATPESELLPPSMAEKIFKEQLDDEYVDKWVQSGGVGFADVIYNQMMERYFNRPEVGPPRGPIPLEKSRADVQPLSLQPKDMTYKIQMKVKEAADVVAPWSGRVLASQSLEHGLQSLLLDHGDGLKSSLVFKGSLLIPELSQVEAGQRLGLLSAENPSVLWKVQL